jgi:hypothetical protein
MIVCCSRGSYKKKGVAKRIQANQAFEMVSHFLLLPVTDIDILFLFGLSPYPPAATHPRFISFSVSSSSSNSSRSRSSSSSGSSRSRSPFRRQVPLVRGHPRRPAPLVCGLPFGGKFLSFAVPPPFFSSSSSSPSTRCRLQKTLRGELK